ncbi:MAG: helix-turn-helix domain-containing protein, partial [Marinobacter sp.]
MANKVKFERENVVRVASELFWKKGFHATSTRDLQDAVNMRPGSIYSAFGSKEGLYSESL